MKITTITLNPAYDLVGTLDSIEYGEVNSVASVGTYPAGKGINVSKVLATLGVSSQVTGFYGQSNQAGFEQAFKDFGLENQFVSVAGATRTNVKVTEANGQSTDFNFQGFSVDSAAWQQFTTKLEQLLTPGQLVAVCGSVPAGVSQEAFKAWLISLNQAGYQVIFDSSNQALATGVATKPWLIKPNHRELEVLVGRKLESFEEVCAAAQELQKSGIANVVISLGSKGSLWINQEGILRATPPKITKVVSTVGAGDSMVAGLIYGLTKGFSKEETLRFATGISAFAVTQGNVGLSSEEDKVTLAEFQAQTNIEVVA